MRNILLSDATPLNAILDLGFNAVVNEDFGVYHAIVLRRLLLGTRWVGCRLESIPEASLRRLAEQALETQSPLSFANNIH